MIPDRDYLGDVNLGLSRNQCIAWIQDLCEENNVTLDKRHSVFEGNTYANKGKVLAVMVGAMELFDSSYDTASAFIVCNFSIRHELAHKNHIEILSHQNTPIARCLTLNHYACSCSLSYYYGRNDSNHRNQSKEMAAQYDSIRCSFNDFKDVTGSLSKANHIVCAYGNLKVSNKDDFVDTDKPFTDYRDILAAYEKRFDVIKDMEKPLSFEPVYGDMFSRFLRERGGGINHIMDKLNDSRSRELMLASIYAKMSGEGEYMKSLECFSGLEFMDFDKLRLIRRTVNKDARLQDLPEINVQSRHDKNHDGDGPRF